MNKPDFFVKLPKNLLFAIFSFLSDEEILNIFLKCFLNVFLAKKRFYQYKKIFENISQKELHLKGRILSLTPKRSCLLEACESNCFILIKYILFKFKSFINYPKAFEICCKNNCTKIILLFFEKEIFDKLISLKTGKSLLKESFFYVCKNNNKKILNLMIKNKIFSKEKGFYGACEGGHSDLIKEVFPNFAGKATFYYVCKGGNKNLFKKYLYKYSFFLGFLGAIEGNHLEIFKKLCKISKEKKFSFFFEKSVFLKRFEITKYIYKKYLEELLCFSEDLSFDSINLIIEYEKKEKKNLNFLVQKICFLKKNLVMKIIIEKEGILYCSYCDNYH